MRCACGLQQVLDARMAADGQRNETIRGDGYGGGDDSDVKINLGSSTSTVAAPRHPPLNTVIVAIIILLLLSSLYFYILFVVGTRGGNVVEKFAVSRTGHFPLRGREESVWVVAVEG